MPLRTPIALLGAALLVLVGPPLLTTGSGAVGFGMRRYRLPVLPAVIGVILGPAAEQQQLRRALQISDGSAAGLVNTPFSVTVYAVIVVLLAWPWLKKFVVRGRSSARSAATGRT